MSLVDGFFDNGGAFEKLASTYLSYETIKQNNDANGSNQAAMLNTASTTTQTQNDPATQSTTTTAANTGTVAGLSMPVLIGLGAAGLVGLVLLIKK